MPGVCTLAQLYSQRHRRRGAAPLESLMFLSAIRSSCISSRSHHPDTTVANKNCHTPPPIYLGFASAHTLVDAGGVLRASMLPCAGKLAQWLQRSLYACGEVTGGHWSQVMILIRREKFGSSVLSSSPTSPSHSLELGTMAQVSSTRALGL